jgi:hypothetical protein
MSFIPQRGHGVDSHGANGGDDAGGHGDDEKDHRRAEEGDGVGQDAAELARAIAMEDLSGRIFTRIDFRCKGFVDDDDSRGVGRIRFVEFPT